MYLYFNEIMFYYFNACVQKIIELIFVLDQRDNEYCTVKGVVEHFSEVFFELVQGGRGHLAMMKKKEFTSLHAKVTTLEHDLHKSCQEASNNHDLCCQLEKEYHVSGIILVILF
ncbi:uncharacterized protein LOC133667830 isoform X1 [Populus nigra]|uniref:uncharacterized protein LOC133667830 isoform X1 n=1 Tax=Populus nigra TaxID=3691 RepID=UPI002B272024|nr:uncharacterized protein LOC133667830 isoform X1 [Populus nigra]